MPASGRFQSRLLSYLSRQRLRLGDRTSRWLRQAVNAVALGAQVVLYPVYVAFQSMRLAGRQMGPAAQRVGLFLENVKRSVQGKPALPASPPLVDAPIHKTLRAIRSAGFATKQGAAPESPDSRAIALRSPADLIPFDPTEDDCVSLTLRQELALAASDAAQLRSPSAQTLAGTLSAEIGGIASRLDSRLLVLVTTTNALIDLSPQQQRWLQQQIIWELADYGRARRRWLKRSGQGLASGRVAGELGSSSTDGAIAALSSQSSRSIAPLQGTRLARMLPVPMPRETAALPVKAFYQLMAWVQTGPVAIAANLFQEAALAVYFPPLEPAPQPAARLTPPANLPHPAPTPSGTTPLSPVLSPDLRPAPPGEVLLHLLDEQNAEQSARQTAERNAHERNANERNADLPTEFIPAERIVDPAAIAPPRSTADLMPDGHSVILTISRQVPNPLTPPTRSPTRSSTPSTLQPSTLILPTRPTSTPPPPLCATKSTPWRQCWTGLIGASSGWKPAWQTCGGGCGANQAAILEVGECRRDELEASGGLGTGDRRVSPEFMRLLRHEFSDTQIKAFRTLQSPSEISE
ncbi:hypothetical protein [Leptolyngbya sp. O-77]|uniref:hypothetical protein n=1 Tax=Leptolyngbya sp. O-77 TaxID=1080068 RepID=UPI00074D416D|nr:hypothetical protein [Leptolyngbya sp. O-77]BAU42885.1 hypothetical protein O77CONTIG1_02707 [Leptolyngbya sp. O-77]